ncbi:hypothetical protein F5146DRAFT_1185678 [Armillaria mellea]|nr:hypothetical protein F5146DRAFT_1185678 [Armillaria mellea]
MANTKAPGFPLKEAGISLCNTALPPCEHPCSIFTPSTNSLVALPVSTPDINSISPRPLSASSSYSSIPSNTATNNYMAGMPSALAPPPIMPSSALRLLNQGRAQGLFTPSTSAVSASRQGYRSPNTFSQYPFSQMPPPSSQPLKRNRSEDAHNEASAPEPQAATEDGPSPTKHA